MTHVLVTGGNGQLGRVLQLIAPQHPFFNFTFADLREMDITNVRSVHSFFKTKRFDYCINCAGYTAVDRAESDPVTTQRVNVTGVEHLAQSCRLNNTRLIHLSTDYVYHNHKNTPLYETDPTHPKGVYAKSKLDGELVARQILPSTTIVRTSWMYSGYGRNFLKTMLELGRRRRSIKVVYDQIGTPTYANDLARVLLQIIEKVERQKVSREALAGIFNYSNEGVTSWYDFACTIFDLEKLDCVVKPIESKDYPTPAKRPPFSVMSKEKIRKTFGLAIPHWRSSLRACLHSMKEKV